MLINETCRELCTKPVTKGIRKKFKESIDDQYMMNWIIDNLPAATRFMGNSVPSAAKETLMLPGYPVGIEKDGRYYLNHHVLLRLSFHPNPSTQTTVSWDSRVSLGASCLALGRPGCRWTWTVSRRVGPSLTTCRPMGLPLGHLPHHDWWAGALVFLF